MQFRLSLHSFTRPDNYSCKMKVVVYALLLAVCSAVPSFHPLSDEFIDLVNSKATTWKAARKFSKTTTENVIKSLMGLLPKSPEAQPLPLLKWSGFQISDLPENFDPRQKWPNCPSLHEIRDQGSCGSCWAISTASVLTDRTCIHSNGKEQFHYSTEDIMSCCMNCGFGCSGGWSAQALRYWVEQGVVSGGQYGSEEGCKPYSIPQCSHHIESDRPECKGILPTPKCSRSCQINYEETYKNDTRFGRDAYRIYGENSLMKELVKNGPVVASFAVYEDFLHYDSGVYENVAGDNLGHHAIKILGYGVENGVKYWLCSNSWNTDWGNKGYFKIKRGSDECGIESDIMAGIPKL